MGQVRNIPLSHCQIWPKRKGKARLIVTCSFNAYSLIVSCNLLYVVKINYNVNLLLQLGFGLGNTPILKNTLLMLGYDSALNHLN